MKKLLFHFLLLALLGLTSLHTYAQCTFTNPIKQAESADPYVIFNNGFYYYMVTTGDGVWIHKAANLQDVGNAPRTKVWGVGGEIKAHVWAPELHYLNGKWYIYTCGSISNGFDLRMFVLEGNSQDPLGSYTYRGILDLGPNQGGIDESVWQDPSNGKIYMAWSQFETQGQTIWIAPMDNPTTLGHPRIRISEPTNNWERVRGNVNEGPIFLKKNNKLHIVYSASQCASEAYSLGRLTCEDGNYLNKDSWDKVGPIFKRNDANGVYGPGHNGFTKSPNGQEDWIIYHAKSGTEFTNSDRSTRLQKFTWNSDDTPNLGVPERMGVQLACASTAEVGTQTPYNGVINVPATFEAEHFDNGGEGISYHDTTPTNLIGPFRSNTAVDTEPCSEGGHNLTLSAPGEWTEYTISIPSAGLYKIDARVASGTASAFSSPFSFEIEGKTLNEPTFVPNTGGWQSWQTFSTYVRLLPGQHVLRYIVSGEFNTNSFTISKVAIQTPFLGVNNIPGVVEAEHFDNGGEGDEGGEGISYHDTTPTNLIGPFRSNTAVDTEPCSEGGHNLAFSANGEWTEYTVKIFTAGQYQIATRVASPVGGIFHIEMDGVNVTGPITVPNTGGWQNWQTVNATVTLPAGQPIMRFVIDQAEFNTNKFTFTPAGVGPVPTGQVYRLVNRQSGKVLDVNECSLNNGMKVQQWPWLGSNCQRWKFTATDNGYYKITAQHSGQALEIGAALTTNGAKANQWPSNDCTCQQWKVESTDDGYYKLTARHSNQVLEVGNALMSDGAQVNQFPWNMAACQQWAIEPALPFARQGVEELAAATSLKLSPNPASDQVNLEWENAGQEGVSITIVDMKGAVVYSSAANTGHSMQLNTGHFQSGIYAVHLKGNRVIATQKLMINR
ncbi:MAG: family 43 glycosylhydrolase [Bacteroidota bacterium]